MKVALIVPRFGENILGGPESHCFQLALRLSENLGWSVHVYTTTAFSAKSWTSFYPEGEERIQNITVFRYDAAITRWPFFFKAYDRFFTPLLQYWGLYPTKIPSLFHFFIEWLEAFWFMLHGPWCPQLLHDLHNAAGAYDRLFFFNYIHYSTVRGLPDLASKSVLIPVAFDEPMLDFPRIRTLFKQVPYIFCNTEVEQHLLMKKGIRADSILVVGCGLNERLFTRPMKASPVIIAGLKQPYIAYLGRIGKSKGVFKLVQYFLQFILQTKNQDLNLVLAGENDGSMNIFYHPQIKFIGYISPVDKSLLISHSACIVQPSSKESQSLLVLEAIAQQRPVLVNANCDVFKFYAKTLQTVFDFGDATEFGEKLTKILNIRKFPEFKHKLKESQKWVQSRYSWEAVLATYKDLPPPQYTRTIISSQNSEFTDLEEQ